MTYTDPLVRAAAIHALESLRTFVVSLHQIRKAVPADANLEWEQWAERCIANANADISRLEQDLYG